MKALFLSSLFENVTLTTAGTIGMVVILAVIVLAAVLVNVAPRLLHKWEIEYKTRDLTYGAVCLSMAYALSWARMFEMPLGGSVTPAALAPLFIYCYYFGFRKGMVISSAYMLLQFTQGVYVVTPWSAFFDYILPCFAVCLVGLFRYKPQKYGEFVKKNKNEKKNAVKYWAYTVGGHWGVFAGAGIYAVVRYISLVISGVISWDYWGYDPAATSYKLTFSLSYNSFSLVDSLIAIVAVLLLLSSRAFNLYMSASFADKKALLENGQEIITEPKTEPTAKTATETAATADSTEAEA